jgi:hypothetical protein
MRTRYSESIALQIMGRRSQVAGRKSQVAGRKSQVASRRSPLNGMGSDHDNSLVFLRIVLI